MVNGYFSFLPRDATQARYMPWPCARLFVRLITALYKCFTYLLACVWLGGVMVRVFDLRLIGRGFDFRTFNFDEKTLGKFLTHICLCDQAV